MIAIINPNTGKKINYETTSIKDTQSKITNLSENRSWNKLKTEKRIQYLETFIQKLERNKPELQHELSLETGKPSWESLSEINAAINKLESTILSFNYRCKYPTLTSKNKNIMTRTKPIGVIGIIAPFNFPLHIPNGQIMPALLTGNKVIIKSSEYTINTTKMIESLWNDVFKQIDSPIQFVYGGSDIGEEIVKNKKVNGIFFTGSSKVGKKIEKKCLELRKMCALEMGGNNPLIIEDATDSIINHLNVSAFITAGQRCSCARRIIINKSEEKIVDQWLNEIKKLNISRYPNKIDTFMGPIVIQETKNKLLTKKYEKSTTILSSRNLGKGGLISPRVEITEDFQDEELFGPIVFICLTNSLEESIEMANKSQFGLTASIYTKNKKKFKYALDNIESGVINWNSPTTGASGIAPFGGIKNSGNHRPAGFSMIDHCVIPVASTQQQSIEKITFPGLHA